MSDPYSFEPRHPAEEPPKVATPRLRISKAAERVWMVCFWATFILALIFALLIAVALTIANGIRIPPLSGSIPIDVAALFWNGIGVFLNVCLALLAAILACVVFARSRSGLKSTKLILIWLVVRVPWLFASTLTLFFLNISRPPNVAIPDIWPALFWLAFFDLPILILCLGAGLAWLLGRKRPRSSGEDKPLPRPERA